MGSRTLGVGHETHPPTWAIPYWTLTAISFVFAVALAVFDAPVESTMGVVQKIFYVHLPSAINTFVGFFIVFIASIGYLVQRRAWWDDLAVAAAKAGVLFCSVVLLTGMTWAKGAGRLVDMEPATHVQPPSLAALCCLPDPAGID